MGGKEGEVDEKGRVIVESNININLDVIYIPQITKHISQIFLHAFRERIREKSAMVGSMVKEAYVNDGGQLKLKR